MRSRSRTGSTPCSSAAYKDGILEVRVPLGKEAHRGDEDPTKIKVKRG